MTKHELEQVYYINRELKMWERELERLRCRSLSPQGGNGGVHGSGVSDPVAALAERRIALEAKIAAKQQELQEARDRAVLFIETIPDSLTRQVVYYRCVSLMSWRRVAYEVGGGNTAEGVRKIYIRFLKRL